MDDFRNLNLGRRQTVIRVIFSFAVTVLVGVAGYAVIRWLANLR
jgi:Tfp pilus assembly protein PilO